MILFIKKLIFVLARIFGIYFENRVKLDALYVTFNETMKRISEIRRLIDDGLIGDDLGSLADELDIEKFKELAIRIQNDFGVLSEIKYDLTKMWAKGELKKIK